MTIGNLVEIYLMAKDKVSINTVDNKEYLFSGFAKDVPPGFFTWQIKRVTQDKDSLVISARNVNNNNEEYNEELKVFDLKSCLWLDNNIKYIVKYKDDTSIKTNVPQTLRILDKEVWNESLVDKFIIKDGYLVLVLDDTRKNVEEQLNR